MAAPGVSDMSRDHHVGRYLAAGALTAAVLVAGGAMAGLLLAPQQAPASLEAGLAVTSAPVTLETFDDTRQLAFQLVMGSSEELPLMRSGTVTTTTCTIGGQLASGDVPLSIDSSPIVALHTDYPLWRDLHKADKGSDVASVQAELQRLGYTPTSSSVMDKATIAAIKAFMTDRGYPKPDGSLLRSDIIWLKAASVTTTACPLSPGDPVGAGDAFATTGGQLLALKPALAVTDLTPGDRVVTFGQARAAVEADGTVTDPAFLATIAASPEFALAMAQAVEGTPPQMTLTSALASPLSVVAVPAGALYGVSGASACISTDGKGLPVTIVSSRLGSTYVVVEDGAAPDIVDLQDAGDRTGGTETCS